MIPWVTKPPGVGSKNNLQLSLCWRCCIFIFVETQTTHFEVQAPWINLTFTANGEEFYFRKNLSFRILPEIWRMFSEILSSILPSQILKAWEKLCTFYLKLKWQVANSENLLHQVAWKLISESSENFVKEIFSNSVCALTWYKQQCCVKNKEILVYSVILILSKLHYYLQKGNIKW